METLKNLQGCQTGKVLGLPVPERGEAGNFIVWKALILRRGHNKWKKSLTFRVDLVPNPQGRIKPKCDLIFRAGQKKLPVPWYYGTSGQFGALAKLQNYKIIIFFKNSYLTSSSIIRSSNRAKCCFMHNISKRQLAFIIRNNFNF